MVVAEFTWRTCVLLGKVIPTLYLGPNKLYAIINKSYAVLSLLRSAQPLSMYL